MALVLAARIAGDDFAQTVQLMIEYDPEPPFDAGSSAKAPPQIVETLRGLAADYRAQEGAAAAEQAASPS